MTLCKLALEDGTVFSGVAVGAEGTRTGEVVFNTAMTGYQEVYTDPSYCGQIVTLTYPQIGNTGVNPEDMESAPPFPIAGAVLRSLPPRPSSHRASATLGEFFRRHEIVAIAGVDTRALTRCVRSHGALRGAISTEIADERELLHAARNAPGMTGANLVAAVQPGDVSAWSASLGGFQSLEPDAEPSLRVVALHCGIKHNILRHLVHAGASVIVVPGSTGAGPILDLAPDAILLGNGPGDPTAVTDTISTVRELLGRIPMLGICLGHQLLALAAGAETYKLPFGHHGANMPVLNKPAERVEITSQNHGFAVDPRSLERVGAVVTHVNLNDGSVEGFAWAEKRVVSVQYHPEASPGPRDAAYLFSAFLEAVRRRGPVDASVFAALRRSGGGVSRGELQAGR